jgi:SP family arabinose:H+ symporter-like MFS transporter
MPDALALPARKTSSFVILVAAGAATAGLLYGYDVAVINSALVFLRSRFALSALEAEMVASIAFWGCAIGAAISGWASDRFGRRSVLLVAGLLFCLADLSAFASGQFWQLLSVRLVAGVGIGSALLVAPLYIAEISPAHARGRLVTVNQLATVSGILIGFLCNFEIAASLHDNWRWMFAAGALPAIALCVSLLWIPESPRWLIQHGQRDRAVAILKRTSSGVALQEALDEIGTRINEETGTYSELFGPALRKPLTLAIMLAIIQQITGVNTVLFYGSILFAEHTGASTIQAIGMNVIVGAVNLVFTIVGLFLIDRLGRRPLLLTGTGGMGICLVAFAVMARIFPGRSELLLVPLLGYVACFAFGLGTGVWVCLAELFPNRIRGRAMSIATVVLWMTVSGVAATFLTLLNAFSASTVFLGYAVLCAASFACIYLLLPETKNRTLEDIERIWSQDSKEFLGSNSH